LGAVAMGAGVGERGGGSGSGRHMTQGIRAAGGDASARRNRAYEVLDTVDFGGAAAGKIQGRPGLSCGTAPGSMPMGKLLFMRRGAGLLKDDGKKKRWHEDKVAPSPASDASEASLRLSNFLESDQPSMAITVSRCAAAVAKVEPPRGEVRRYRRARGQLQD